MVSQRGRLPLDGRLRANVLSLGRIKAFPPSILRSNCRGGRSDSCGRVPFPTSGFMVLVQISWFAMFDPFQTPGCSGIAEPHVSWMDGLHRPRRRLYVRSPMKHFIPALFRTYCVLYQSGLLEYLSPDVRYKECSTGSLPPLHHPHRHHHHQRLHPNNSQRPKHPLATSGLLRPISLIHDEDFCPSSRKHTIVFVAFNLQDKTDIQPVPPTGATKDVPPPPKDPKPVPPQ